MCIRHCYDVTVSVLFFNEDRRDIQIDILYCPKWVKIRTTLSTRIAKKARGSHREIEATLNVSGNKDSPVISSGKHMTRSRSGCAEQPSLPKQKRKSSVDDEVSFRKEKSTKN